MKQNSTSDLVNLAQQVISQTENSHTYFRDLVFNPAEERNDLLFQLFKGFFDATHTANESYQSFLELYKKDNQNVRFQNEINKTRADLFKILSVNFDEINKIKENEIFYREDWARGTFVFCLMLAGLAALSFLSPAAIAGIMAFLFGAVPCALSSAATLAAIATGAFIFLAPVFV